MKCINDCEGIIYKIANKYKSISSIDDLYQAGVVGVIKAYKKYKSGSCKFTTYAYKYILGEIIEVLRKDKSIIVSDEVYELYKRYSKLKELMNGKSFSDICSYMNINENYMLRIIESINITKSVEDDEIYLDERDKVEDSILLENELESLEEYERNLINYRYFFGYSQNETAKLLGTNQVSVSRNEKLILNKIRNNLI